jgi:hypothetical protein
MSRIALLAAAVVSLAAPSLRADTSSFMVANRTDVSINSMRIANAGAANWSDEVLTGVALGPGRNAMLNVDGDQLYDVALWTSSGACVLQNVELNDIDPNWEITAEVLSSCNS